MELVVKERDREAKVRLERRDGGYRVRVDEAVYDVDVALADGGLASLVVEGRQFVVSVRPRAAGRYLVSGAGGDTEVELMDPLTFLALQSHDAGTAGACQVSAYMPGRVVQVLVAEGEEVEAGQGLVVLEAMKMENEIQAERAGVVRKVYVRDGQTVEGGDPLFEIA